MNGRQAGAHVAEASRTLPPKRGEKMCEDGAHATKAVSGGEPCPTCGAQK